MDHSDNQLQLLYKLDEKPRNIADMVLYSVQWVLIMFYPVIWGYAIVGTGMGLTGNILAEYIGRVVLMIGISTLIQVLCGHTLAMISGPNIIPSLAIVAAFEVGGKDYALLSFNAYIIAGIIVAVLGVLGVISYIGKIWTPLTQGAMLLMIGLTTSFSGMELLATYQAVWPYYVGIFLALLCGYLSIRGKGVFSTIPVAITIISGYIIFIAGGKFDWSLVHSMSLIEVPEIFPFGMDIPPLDLVITMTIVHLFSAINLYGNVQGYSGILGVKLTKSTEKRYFGVFGLIEGSLAGILGVPSHTPYGENLGFLLLTKVASRYFMMIASIIFIILSFFGKVTGLMAAMPSPVAGAILLGVASTLIGIGADSMKQSGKFETREMFIIGFSVFFALGTSRLPAEFFANFPRLAGTLLSNSVISVIVLVIILEQNIFRENEGGNRHVKKRND